MLQGWYHIVLHISATQGTWAPRVEASPWASSLPTLEACLSVLPWQELPSLQDYGLSLSAPRKLLFRAFRASQNPSKAPIL